MPHSTPLPSRLFWLFAVLLAVIALAVTEARAETGPWKIETERDKLTDQVERFAITMPKSDPVQQGKSLAVGLIIKCGSVSATGPKHPELMILFDSLAGLWRVKTVATRFRFDDGPVHSYKLSVSGKGRAHAILLPKFSDQDPAADLLVAKRLRVEFDLPHAGFTLLDFNVAGATDAVHAISCH